jgi:hypothetical protein
MPTHVLVSSSALSSLYFRSILLCLGGINDHTPCSIAVVPSTKTTSHINVPHNHALCCAVCVVGLSRRVHASQNLRVDKMNCRAGKWRHCGSHRTLIAVVVCIRPTALVAASTARTSAAAVRPCLIQKLCNDHRDIWVGIARLDHPVIVEATGGAPTCQTHCNEMRPSYLDNNGL